MSCPDPKPLSYDLMQALEAATKANPHTGRCDVCIMLEGMSDPLKEAVKSGLAGTIGMSKLVLILTNFGYEVGRRSIERHRREAHTP